MSSFSTIVSLVGNAVGSGAAIHTERYGDCLLGSPVGLFGKADSFDDQDAILADTVV